MTDVALSKELLPETDKLQVGMQPIKRILLTGGGTAGHVNPALAIGSVFSATDAQFLFVGVRGRVEETVVPREGIPIKFVRASGFPSGISSDLLKFSLNLLIGTIQSLFILLRFRPEVIIGTGGYVSAPVVIAASLLRKLRMSRARIFIHEQNAVPGKLNRLMGRFAHQVFVTFPETLIFFPKTGVLSGYPLRRRIARLSQEEARRKIDIKIPEGRKVILAFGGSQGARTINRALVDALGYLIPHRNQIFIVHGTGLFKSADYNAMKDTEHRIQSQYSEEQRRQILEFYHCQEFFHEIQNFYAISSLVVARGGAGSLNEISAMGLPALIIPKANLPGDHQVMNARSMERAGGAEILYEQIHSTGGKLSESIDGKILAEKLISMIEDEPRLQQMSRFSCTFLHQDALTRIERRIRGIDAEPDRVQPQAVNYESLPSNEALMSLLEKALEKQKGFYRPENIISRPQDLEYMKNRASALLISSAWQNRNVGIKLLGLLGAKEKIPALLTLFFERKRASIVKRAFGGDFEQVGFIRRNIVTALIRLNELSPEVEKTLLVGLLDPYYEVRAEAARAAAYYGDRLSSPERFIEILLRLLTDPVIDVSVESAEALGKLGGERDALPALLGFWDARLWKIRAAVLRGIFHLVERGVIDDLEMLEQQMPRFILTSTDFTPQFEIKAAYRRLMESVFREKEKRTVQ